jgi:selenocysteine-specific elongation factor
MHVIGTAGHVDHGKSTLIERLTGIDPDRLAEEKERGLTIDLGFAWLTLPSGRDAGIVDVPGHERFVHNMLAGVGSIDATIFVVAANEGWKPQSEEHLAILDLLGARAGVVALTKRDLVSDEALERVSDHIRTRLAGTPLEEAAIVPVSSTTGDGIEALIAELDAMLARTPESPDNGRARLFADRSFTMKGSGTVITGTLTGGRLRVDDDVEILPSGSRARIRSIQTHKVRRDEATPGSRVALNIAGLDRHEVRRGDAIVRPGRWTPTDMLDVWMRPVRGIERAISRRGAFKLYLGSAEVDARVRFIEPSGLAPGGEAFARLLLASPVVADEFDRFVLRDSGRGETIAGGLVLDAHPVRRRLPGAAQAQRAAELRARREAGRAGLLERIVEERGSIATDDAERLAGVRPAAGPVSGFAVSDAWMKEAVAAVTAGLEKHHASNPLTRGMPRDEARAASGIGDARLFAALIAGLSDRISAEGPLLRLTSHTVSLSPEQVHARDRLVSELDVAGLQPPTVAELSRTHGGPLVTALVESGELVKFSSDYALTKQRYETAKTVIAEAIAREGSLTASRAREVLGTSRKYVIPFLEHLDAIGFTTRSGDVRTLGRRGSS